MKKLVVLFSVVFLVLFFVFDVSAQTIYTSTKQKKD